MMPSKGDFSSISPNLHSVQLDIPGEDMKLFLFLMTLTGNQMMGMLTPVGGFCLMAGWLLFALQALRIPKSTG
jgi:hypothetical protein